MNVSLIDSNFFMNTKILIVLSNLRGNLTLVISLDMDNPATMLKY